MVSPLYSKVAVWTLQASLLTETATYTFPNFRNQLFSVTSSFVLKKQISWKITWKLGAKLRKRDDSSSFLHWVPLSIKYLLESNRKNKYIALRKNALYEIFNAYLRQDQVCPNWKYILLAGKVLPWLSPLWLVQQKINYAIWYFCFYASPGN